MRRILLVDDMKPVRDAIARDRERLVVATGPVIGYFPGAIRKAAEKATDEAIAKAASTTAAPTPCSGV